MNYTSLQEKYSTETFEVLKYIAKLQNELERIFNRNIWSIEIWNLLMGLMVLSLYSTETFEVLKRYLSSYRLHPVFKYSTETFEVLKQPFG